ncbi:MAG TPA: J domain-containing protein [Candidatus Deferrimicrobium sp.]|nr:J domain-containing protein [Candidatus Deferrimicrobium sp.]
MTRAPTRTDYTVLGLRPGAGDDEIRDAYRRLAKIHHPDRNPGDPLALATFARLSESYAALRGRSRGGLPPGATPLSAAAGRRAHSRREAETVAMADLAVGGAAWIAADAVLVGPGRLAALHPAAAGTAFPSSDRVIRVERRPDGLHVFMPPQPSARWPVSWAAETDGLAVAALWVGDRQDHGGGPAAAARMPLRLMTGTVAELAVDSGGWVAEQALAVDGEGHWTLNPDEPVGPAPHRATPVRVLRAGDGFRVHSDLPAAARRGTASSPIHGHERIAVLSAELGGDSFPTAPPPS